MNSYCFGSAQPAIPERLMHEMYEIKSGTVFSQEDGGQWISGEDKRIPFKGALLPVSNKDLVRDIAGAFTQYSEKIYTNGHILQVGAQVEDFDGKRYTVTQELGYNSLHPLKRYLVERKGEAAVK